MRKLKDAADTKEALSGDHVIKNEENVLESEQTKAETSRLKRIFRRKKTKMSEEERDALLENAGEVKILDLNTFLSILHMKWKVFLVLIAAVLFVSAIVSYSNSEDRATCVMSLNYEESSKGRNPNNTRFNISELRSIEVAKLAIDSAGMTGEIEPRDIVDAISITTYSNKNFVSEDEYYISSSYVVSFEKPFGKMGDISAKDMLNLICKEYKNNFYKDYIVTTKILENEKPNLENMDHFDIGSYFSLMAERINRYLAMRIDQASSFTTENGETFKSAKELVSNFKTYDLQNYNAYVWENGIAKDKIQQQETLTYLNNKLQWQYDEKIKNNRARISTINEYNQAMTSSVLIPTYDQDDEFYMSRTKTGIDDIAKDADADMTEAKSIELEVATNSDKIEKLNLETTDQQMTVAADMVVQIQKKIESIIERVVLIDKEYIMQKTRNYITFAPRSESLLHRVNAKGNLALGVALFAALYIFFVIKKKKRVELYLKESIKEYSGSEAE